MRGVARQALEFLEAVRSIDGIMAQPGMQEAMQNYYTSVVRRYRSELDRIARMYEAQKASPPLQRSIPPVAGHIEWSRQLFRRISQPMQLIEKHDRIRQDEHELEFRDSSKKEENVNSTSSASDMSGASDEGSDDDNDDCDGENQVGPEEDSEQRKRRTSSVAKKRKKGKRRRRRRGKKSAKRFKFLSSDLVKIWFWHVNVRMQIPSQLRICLK